MKNETKFNQRIEDELTPIDIEQRYREFLDECYQEVELGGLTFSPSRIIEELDPTAFRCGLNDFADSEDLFELNGEYYDQDEVNTIEQEIEEEEQEEETEEEEEEEEEETKS